MKPLLLALCALTCNAGTVDTDAIYSSGGWQFRFNADGQAFSLAGEPISAMFPFGFDPQLPCDPCGVAVALVVDPPPFVPPEVPLPPSPPITAQGEVPEPATWLVGAGLIALGGLRRRVKVRGGLFLVKRRRR